MVAGGGAVRTVLVVDDEESLRLLVQMTLARGPYRTLLASDGEEGLRLARQELPDLVLLDVGLPGSTGSRCAVSSADRPSHA